MKISQTVLFFIASVIAISMAEEEASNFLRTRRLHNHGYGYHTSNDDHCAHDGDAFCKDIGGYYAEAKPNRECYNDFDDCKCKYGWYKYQGKCVKDNSHCVDDGSAFCKHIGGIYADAIPGRKCYNDFDDCKCKYGYYKYQGKCVKKDDDHDKKCAPDGSAFCKEIGGFYADAIPGRPCYDSFGDCKCKEGYYKKDGKCVKKY